MHHQQAPPQQVHNHYHGPPAAAAPQVGGGIGGGGLGSALATGMAMGAGSEIAHQAIRGMMGSGSSHGQAPAQQQQPAPIQQAPVQYAQPVYEQPQQVVQQQNPCMSFNQSFLNCLKANANSIEACQQNMDMLMQCEKDSRFSMGGI